MIPAPYRRHDNRVPTDLRRLTAAGRPVGLQIVGARGEDAAVLKMAAAIERLIVENERAKGLAEGGIAIDARAGLEEERLAEADLLLGEQT